MKAQRNQAKQIAGPREHWEEVYRAKAVSEVSWYQPEAKVSLELVQRVAPNRESRIIDVGGGASTLVDGLLELGYVAVTVLDLAGASLAVAQHRLGKRAEAVTWIESDVLTAPLRQGEYDIWHDRAVFHFLTKAKDRKRYVERTLEAVRPGGHAILATFALDGPPRCSGLDVVRYSPQTMQTELGDAFTLLDSVREEHRTPSGATQAFVYCVFRVAR